MVFMNGGIFMKSLWEIDFELDKRDTLNEDISTSTLVIGAGMAGLLTAYKLHTMGEDVVVVDCDTVAGGQTKNTTAKITSQHDNIYSTLLTKFEKSLVAQYANANQLAIKEYRDLIISENIDCDFKIAPSYLYSCNDEEKIKQEYTAAQSLGIDAQLTNKTELPFPVSLAVRFENQAQFSPLKFIKHICKDLTIYENTRVISIDKENLVKTSGGYIFARNIVFACHFPFVNFPGLFFARMHQERSYVLALENAIKLNGMYKSIDSNGNSFRCYKDYLLLGGEGHRTGDNFLGNKYENLRNTANKMFPQSNEVAHWSAQDCITADGVPYIGRYPMTKRSWYVATGFGKWGMTSSMIASNIISDLILDKKPKNADIFTPDKFRIHSIPEIVKDTAVSVKNLYKEKFTSSNLCLNQIPVGNAGIINFKGNKFGVYRKSDNEIYFVTVKCPHLGCQLTWNDDEKTWDCPCHGSRFDYKGKCISNPAQESIYVEPIVSQ